MRGMRSAQLPRGKDGLRRRQDYKAPAVWRRWAAGFLDWMVTLGWALSVAVVVAAVTALIVTSEEYPFGLNFGAGLVYFGLPIVSVVLILRFAMNVHKVSSRSETLGHRLFDLKVYTLDGEQLIPPVAFVWQFLGSPILFAYFVPLLTEFLISALFNVCLMSCVREGWPNWADEILHGWVVWGLPASLILGLFNHGLMLLDKRARGWHDRICGIEVLQKSKIGTVNPANATHIIDQNWSKEHP